MIHLPRFLPRRRSFRQPEDACTNVRFPPNLGHLDRRSPNAQWIVVR